MRTLKDWSKICEQISAGYTPGGSKTNTPASGLVLVSFLQSHRLLWPGIRILDVGCGNGRLAIGLALSKFSGRYCGFDIIRPCIDFCRKAFEPYPGFEFAHIDLHSQHYWPKGKIAPIQVVYPYSDSSFDLVCAFSLFSHTSSPGIALRNLQEMKRVMRPGSTLLSTWYLGDWGDYDASEGRTVYPSEPVKEMFRSTGLMITDSPSWPATDQVVILAVK